MLAFLPAWQGNRKRPALSGATKRNGANTPGKEARHRTR
jgi:hypothetical protein